MRVRIIGVTVICLAVAGVTGCGQSGDTCGIADYVGGDTGGYQTPQQALRSVLARHEQWLSATGWKLTEQSASGARFVSGSDSVDVVTNKAGKWNVGATTACK